MAMLNAITVQIDAHHHSASFSTEARLGYALTTATITSAQTPTIAALIVSSCSTIASIGSTRVVLEPPSVGTKLHSPKSPARADRCYTSAATFHRLGEMGAGAPILFEGGGKGRG